MHARLEELVSRCRFIKDSELNKKAALLSGSMESKCVKIDFPRSFLTT